MKYSIQRKLIYETICENPVHPTAEEVYQLVKEKMPNIGIATVYRNLSSMAGRHELRKFHSEDGLDRYDADLHEHPHFHCTKCKRVYDYQMDGYPQVKEAIMKSHTQHGMLSGVDIIIRGVCKHCM